MSIYKKIIATREKYYSKTLQIILLILLVTFTGMEFKALLRPGKIHIETYAAEVNPKGIDPKPEEAHAEVITSTNGMENPSLVGDVEKLVCDTFGSECKIALAVMKAESQGDCSRVGDKHIMFEKNGVNYGASYGCFQIRHLFGRNKEVGLAENEDFTKEMLNPVKNINAAKKIYEKHGWSAWSAYSNKSYLRYL